MFDKSFFIKLKYNYKLKGEKYMEIYDFTVLDNQNKEVKMQQYKGKTLLIVNTATGCGFTPQYEGLENLYKKYNKDGFEVLDFPCNQFGHQAPGTASEIATFCVTKYGTSFKQFAKIDVNGKNASPLFEFLKSKTKGILGKNIKWNFTKFLVDKNGNVVKRFSPMTKPEQIEEDIANIL